MRLSRRDSPRRLIQAQALTVIYPWRSGGILSVGFLCHGRITGDETGVGWIEKLMPPVVTGAIVMIIGLNLAPVTIKGVGEPV